MTNINHLLDTWELLMFLDELLWYGYTVDEHYWEKIDLPLLFFLEQEDFVNFWNDDRNNEK